MYHPLIQKHKLRKKLTILTLASLSLILLGNNQSLRSTLNTTFLTPNSDKAHSQIDQNTALTDGFLPDDALRPRNARSLSAENLEQARTILIRDGLSPMEAEILLDPSLIAAEDSL